MTRGAPIPGLLHLNHVTSGKSRHLPETRLHFSTKQRSQLPHLPGLDEDSGNDAGTQVRAHSRAQEGAETDESRGRAAGPKRSSPGCKR